MATPVGHGALGVAVGYAGGEPSGLRGWIRYAVAIIGANLPDLDFLPGVLVGDVNRFHQLYSHTLLAAVAFGIALVALFWNRTRLRVRLFVTGACLYGSHLLLDTFTRDLRAPYGIPLLWPISSTHFLSPWAPLGGVKHGVPGDPFSVFLSDLFSWGNFETVLYELLVLVPVLLLVRYLFDPRGPAVPRGARS